LNYIKCYDELITNAQHRADTKEKALIILGYVEKHHILPKCMGGTDEKSNLVFLSAREHYIAHQLLAKINPKEPGLIFACLAMCSDTNGQRLNNRLYDWIKRKNSLIRKSLNKDNCEWIKKMAVTKSGRTAENCEITASITEKLNTLPLSIRTELVKRRLSGETFTSIFNWILSEGIDITYGSIPRIFYREVKKIDNTLGDKRTISPKVKSDIISRTLTGESIEQICLDLSEKNYAVTEDKILTIITKFNNGTTGNRKYIEPIKGRSKETHEYLKKNADNKRKFSEYIVKLIVDKIDECQDYNLTVDWLYKEHNLKIAYSTVSRFYQENGKNLKRKKKLC
jgi:hypothetical protein